ncbi:MAG: DUF3467 domain-containing protein [Bacteroidota bacterium]
METQQFSFINYSNRTTITSSPFDFIMDFKLIVPKTGPDGGKPEIEEFKSVVVAMSPQHFKSFLNIAQKQLQNYEEQFGEINLKVTNQTENVGQ